MVGLAVLTVGASSLRGEILIEIVPSEPTFIIQVQVNPADADNVYRCQEALVRFESVHDQNLPRISGKVRTISADRFTDERTGQAHFRAEFEVSPQELKSIEGLLAKKQLRPGLPVEAMLTVRKRSALQYMLEPLTAPSATLHEQ